MDKLLAMAAFIKIAELGSLTRAAEIMGSSPPTMVRLLAGLEENLNVRLLHRTTRRIALTDEGRYYLDQCRVILTGIEEMESALSSQQQEPKGNLLVSAPVLFGQMHFAPLVSKFIERYPQVHVDMLLLDRLVNLVEENVDVAIRIGNLSDSSLVAVALGHIRRVVCASPRFLRRSGIPDHPKQLSHHECVRVTDLIPGNLWPFHEKGRSLQIPVNGHLSCNQAAAAIDACVDGRGFGVFLSYQVQPYVQTKKLKIVLEKYEPPPIPVNIVYPYRKFLSARVQRFVKWMSDHLRQKLA
ncbi:MAG: LysR family transcriptional regulator [Gammaproteobacteria bacterium]|nr:LysR family transcriptional regulator [Gammaproteobacteria bacterium]